MATRPLARDVPELGSFVPSTTLRRFWTMLAHWHGQVWNGAEFGRAFGISHTTVRRCLDLLASVFVVRQLQPWHENIPKRQVRAPKVYIDDAGMLHALLGLPPERAQALVGLRVHGSVLDAPYGHRRFALAERCGGGERQQNRGCRAGRSSPA